MADARFDVDWSHTSAVLAMLANCNLDPKKRSRPYIPADFHPSHRRPAAKPTEKAADLKILKTLFVE
jgi:hypothetical protein